MRGILHWCETESLTLCTGKNFHRLALRQNAEYRGLGHLPKECVLKPALGLVGKESKSESSLTSVS